MCMHTYDSNNKRRLLKIILKSIEDKERKVSSRTIIQIYLYQHVRSKREINHDS